MHVTIARTLYRLQPEAFFIDPVGTAPAGTLRFGRGAFEYPAASTSQTPFIVSPTVSGGSGDLTVSTDSFRVADLLGATGGLLLVAIAVLGLRRRKQQGAITASPDIR